MTNDTPAWDGVPENPEKDAFHWLLRRNAAWAVAWLWHADADGCGTEYSGAWAESDVAGQPETMARWYSYLGPCLTPSEVAAREQAAAVAMQEATARMSSSWGRDLFGDADDYKRGWNDACDEVGSSIRALPIETSALDAMLAHAREEGAKAEREACTIAAEREERRFPDFSLQHAGEIMTARRIAAAIRARGAVRCMIRN